MCQNTREYGKDEQKSGGYTYDEAVELTGHGRYNYLLLIACCIITKGVVLDMFSFAIVVTVAKCDLQLGITETGVLASAPFAGVLLGYPWGYYADTRGRRPALLLSTLVGFVFAAICTFSYNWQLMMFFKVISCIFSSAGFTLTMTILGECTGTAHRSKYLFIMNSINMLSDTFTFGLAYFLLRLEFSYPISFLFINFKPWRLYTLVLALPLGIGGLMMLYLHESPKFLASRGDNKKSLEVLRSIYKWNGGKADEYPVQHLVTTDTSTIDSDKQTSFWHSLVTQTVPIFKPPLLLRTFQLTFLMVVCVCTNNAFAMWFPTMVNIFFTKLSGSWDTQQTFCSRLFEADHIAVNSSLNYINTDTCDDSISLHTIFSGIIYGLFTCLVTLVVAEFAVHRKLVFIFWLAVAGTSCVFVDLYQPIASLIFFLLLQTAAIGLPSLASYFVDLYPTSCRGTASSIGMTVTRLCSLAAVNLVGAVITDYCSLTFYAWAGFVFSGIVVALFLPPDKKMNEISK